MKTFVFNFRKINFGGFVKQEIKLILPKVKLKNCDTEI